MTNSPNENFLTEIDAFLSETGMGASYFGKVSTGNSELVARLRGGGRVWPETENKARGFMSEYRAGKKATAERTEAAVEAAE